MLYSDLNKDWYRTGEVGKMLGHTQKTIYSWCIEDKVKYSRTDTNRLVIPKDEVIRLLKERGLLFEIDTRYDVIYSRVSSQEQKTRGDLDRQSLFILNEARDMNLKNPLILQDVGSGLNTNRKNLNKLIKLVEDKQVDRVFISNKDRLTRYGYEYLVELFSIFNTKVIVIKNKEQTPQEELVEDMMSLLASFSGKLYALRRAERKKITQELESILGEDSE